MKYYAGALKLLFDVLNLEEMSMAVTRRGRHT